MLTNSEDDLPDVPTTYGSGSFISTDQENRLQFLENELARLRADMHGHRNVWRVDEAQQSGPPSRPAQIETKVVEASSLESPSAAPRKGLSATPPPEEMSDSVAQVQYELRALVPHLSPAFLCSFNDTVLLLSAIQNGGCVAGGANSLMDKVNLLQAEKRYVEQQLLKRTGECENLKDEVADVKQKLRAVQQEARQSASLLSQRREELRKQLLLEEGRTSKLQVKNRQLEMEVEKLKERVRAQLR